MASIKILHVRPLIFVKIHTYNVGPNTAEQTTALFNPIKPYCLMQAASSFLFCFYFYFCDLIATSIRGRGKGGNQIKIPLYYPAVGMPLAGIRARLRSSARRVLGGLPPVHKRNYSDRRAGDTKRPDVPVEGTQEDGTAPSGPRVRNESRAGRRKLGRGAHPASRPMLAHGSPVCWKSVQCQ